MSEPFLAEIKMVGFNFAPRGWAFCDGQILPINQNQSLYSLLGTTYGGDGRTTFALPGLRGRAPIHTGLAGGGTTDHRIGAKGGAETVGLSNAEMPEHNHQLGVTTENANLQGVGNFNDSVLASANVDMYKEGAGDTTLITATISTVGTGQGHNNMQASLAVNFCIALQGLFPSRN
jgi:microcystin-dependent protein